MREISDERFERLERQVRRLCGLVVVSDFLQMVRRRVSLRLLSPDAVPHSIPGSYRV